MHASEVAVVGNLDEEVLRRPDCLGEPAGTLIADQTNFIGNRFTSPRLTRGESEFDTVPSFCLQPNLPTDNG
jgi:hypothetical protein